DPDAPRATAQQDPWHYSIGRMVDACASAGILPFYGPYGDIRDTLGCETQFRAAFLLGCVGAWSLHPVQIDIAKKVFSPDPDEAARLAADVLELEINGHMPRGVLVDGRVEVEHEYYAGVVWDGLRKEPVMLFSDMGGIDIEEVAQTHPDHVGRGHFSNLLPF